MSIRLAVIGMGDMGVGHARGFDRLDACDLVAICDVNADWRAARPIDWTRKEPHFFTDYRAMLSEMHPDAVVIAVPDFLHREVALDCLAEGCHLLLEKPVATTLAECDAIMAEAEERERIVQIGLVYRYSQLYRMMARQSFDGPVGPVKLMWCKELRQCFPQKDWFYEQDKCGGTMVEKNCHHFDIFNWVIASRPVRVSAFGGQHVFKFGEPIEIHCNYTPEPPLVKSDITTLDHAIVNITYENGAVASLILCMYLRPQNVMPEGLEIGAIGLNGMQMCAYQDARIGIGGAGREWEWLPYNQEADHQYLGHIGCQQERIEFLECVQTGKPPFADLQVGRDSLAVAIAAEQSAREAGAPVQVE